MTNKPVKPNEKDGLSRRQFIKNTGLVAGGVVGGSIFGGLLTNQFQKGPAPSKNKELLIEDLTDARMFFSRKEDFDILSVATERLFPKNDDGPGAIELGIPYFIDKQLAGPWGINAKEYMKGPFIQTVQFKEIQDKNQNQDRSGPNAETQTPTPTPRYQTRLKRSDVFLQGLRKMESVSQDNFKVQFVDATGEQQDEILHLFEDNKVPLNGVDSATFFKLLLKTTIEGAYSDPVYGGNKDMMGWTMKEYPGPRMGYIADIEKPEFIKMKPESLRDYQTFG